MIFSFVDTDVNIINLGAIEILRFDDEIEGHLLAAAYRSQTFLAEVKLKKDDILIVGDRRKIQEYAIETGIKLLLLVNNVRLPEGLVDITFDALKGE